MTALVRVDFTKSPSGGDPDAGEDTVFHRVPVPGATRTRRVTAIFTQVPAPGATRTRGKTPFFSKSRIGGPPGRHRYSVGRPKYLSKRPAAAVIPAPIAYIKVVAVKKLVVEPWAWLAGPPHRVHWSGRAFPSGEPHGLHWPCRGARTFTLKKLECSKQAFARIH
jgi:hypothetical protein